MTWNGTVYRKYTLPVLFIYQDEITTRTRYGLHNNPNSGELLCKSPHTGSITWISPNGSRLDEIEGDDIVQIRSQRLENFPTASKLRNKYGHPNNRIQSGLWSCTVWYWKNRTSIFVGIYHRGAGKGFCC